MSEVVFNHLEGFCISHSSNLVSVCKFENEVKDHLRVYCEECKHVSSGILRWAVLFSHLLKVTTTLWEGAEKFGLAFISP
jgi:hypothetical protein